MVQDALESKIIISPKKKTTLAVKSKSNCHHLKCTISDLVTSVQPKHLF